MKMDLSQMTLPPTLHPETDPVTAWLEICAGKSGEIEVWVWMLLEKVLESHRVSSFAL